MRYFPIFVDLAGRKVVVVGGGEEALRKIRLLLKTDAEILVIAPKLHEELLQHARVKWLAKIFEPQLLAGAALVYSAEAELNAEVSAAAIAAGIPINAVDQAEISTFIVPSIVDRDPVVIAIGTEGTAPVLGQGIRAKIDALLPQKLGVLAKRAAALRARVAQIVPHGQVRRTFWQQFFFGPLHEDLMEHDDVAYALSSDDLLHNFDGHVAGKVSFVGIGPGDAELLTLKAQRKLYEADVIVHDRNLPPAFLEMARRDAFRILAPHTQRELEDVLAHHASAGKIVVRLVCGSDQNEQGWTELQNFKHRGFAVDFVPGIEAAKGEISAIPFPTNSLIQDEILRAAS
jgi:uroporphyrin-III C-methyltransferase / precorrin-2 dehydrogenase / sirohydrochlorin ferrochelatase